MDAQFAALGNKDGKTTEQALQDEIAGDDVLLHFNLKGDDKVFLSQVFKQGQTFEWVKHKVSLKLECKYQDLLLFYNNKRIPEPFCLVDMNITQETNIEVTIAEGAEIGLDRLREQVAKEIENDGGLEEMKDE